MIGGRKGGCDGEWEFGVDWAQITYLSVVELQGKRKRKWKRLGKLQGKLGTLGQY